jgi:3'5'-cyclic nucleotide phosphodiesterase/Adenylate and Guanylate cyclase catalytic domain
MADLTKKLEVCLGPSTGDLKGRCGLHSGPVTAGVLRGEKARFQLFGDTMNTASRMESSGIPGRIHVSRETASLLEEAGKASWVSLRKEKVTLKGKGELQTFFVCPEQSEVGPSLILPRRESQRVGVNLPDSGHIKASENYDIVDGSDQRNDDAHDRLQRLVHWNTEVLYLHLVNLFVGRCRTECLLRPKALQSFRRRGEVMPSETVSDVPTISSNGRKDLLIHEMTEIIAMPDFRAKAASNSTVALDLIASSVKDELRQFVQQIASMYRDVPFHNFEHASHVIMSAGKLMKRIMNPDEVDIRQESTEVARSIHKKTYGISSDPLMQFAVVFSALIHDVDHTGLTNKELVESHAPVASAYGERSVAEQNSVDIAWKLLMDDTFLNLRNAIFPTVDEKQRFRQFIVNAVMATDIADKELQEWRKSRWETTFNVDSISLMDDKVLSDRKATIVFEYIIQASDGIHCMQHWLTYQKFNSRLFEERYVAWLKQVPGSSDPAVGWFEGEIWFFDNYIIPLAQKLHECGVFGVSYHESLNYAQQNLVEWKQKGLELVREMAARCQEKYKNRGDGADEKELMSRLSLDSLRD